MKQVYVYFVRSILFAYKFQKLSARSICILVISVQLKLLKKLKIRFKRNQFSNNFFFLDDASKCKENWGVFLYNFDI